MLGVVAQPTSPEQIHLAELEAADLLAVELVEQILVEVVVPKNLLDQITIVDGQLRLVMAVLVLLLLNILDHKELQVVQ